MRQWPLLILVWVGTYGVPASAWNSSCDAERVEYCADYETDAGRAYCLFHHYNQLSRWCKGTPEINDFVVLPGERVSRCKSDIESLCPTTLNEGGKLTKCLLSHFSKLSMDCRLGSNWGQALGEESKVNSPGFKAAKKQRKVKQVVKKKRVLTQVNLNAACSFEIYFYCRESRSGGKLEGCLQANKDKVRAPCRKALEASEAFHAGK